MRARLFLFIVLLIPAKTVGAAEPAIAFGTRHALALRSNGDILSWGDAIMCQLGRGTKGNTGPIPTLVMRNGIEIAAASEHSLVLTSDGKVYGWGTNPEGPLGVGHTHDVCEGPALVQSLADKQIVHIATGYGFSVAVTASGDLYCSGDNAVGQCPAAPRGGRTDVFLPVPIPELAGRVVAVRTGAFHTLALTRDGRLFAFGRGAEGQLGNGKSANGAGVVAGLTRTVSFGAGTWHSVAVQEDGTVWTWGSNLKSQLCDGSTANRPLPARLPVPFKVTQVSAGGHGTLMKASDGSLYACGDNQFGALGLDRRATIALPTRIAGPPVLSPLVSAGIANSAFSPDGCTVRIAGLNDNSVVQSGGAAQVSPFTARANLSLCAAAAATAQASLPNVVHEAPHGGESGCWTPRKEEDGAADPKLATLRRAMLSAEDLFRRNAAFMAAPEPVRMRTSLSASPGSARMHILAVAERKEDGTRIWSTGCTVIPQVDRIGGGIAQVSVFFNVDVRAAILGPWTEVPKITGRAAGYPEYNGWVVMTKDGRLPWIPHTLEDKLSAEGARREKALGDWMKSSASLKPPDPAFIQKTYEMLKKTDPAGAERFLVSMKEQTEETNRKWQTEYPATTAQLRKEVEDYKRYRASFSAEALQAPAVWGDPTGEGKRRLDARIAELNALPAEEQRQADEWGREARVLERQAQTEMKNQNPAEAARLRARSNELGLKMRALRKAHQERASHLIADADAQYRLTNLKPGDRDKAISFKPDPEFPSSKDPNRIQVIGVAFRFDADARKPERRAWGQRVRETFDFSSLAALLR